MADNEEGEKAISRGNDWEVVTLTASAYASTPGPEQVELNDSNMVNTVEDEAETSHVMFMSGHFVFPPSQHENLPLEPRNIEIQNAQGTEDDVPELGAEVGDRSDTKKDEENWKVEGMTMPEEFPGILFFDEKGNWQSIHGNTLEERTTLEGLNYIEKEQSGFSASKFSSFHSEIIMDESTTYDECKVTSEQSEPSEGGLDSDSLQLPELAKDDKYDNSVLPCNAWWKRRAASLYSQAKEANAFWSIFIAAAVMGLVMLGQHWQLERWQVLQLKWQLNINDEKLGRMLGPISRFKDLIVGGNRRSSIIRGSSSMEL